MKKIIFLILLIILFSLQAEATNYYVDQSIGNNSNAGTEIAPWLTMIYGAKQLSAGDTLYVKNGTYATCVPTLNNPPGYTPNPDGYDMGIMPANSGTSENPITIKVYPGHKPVIDGTTANWSTIGSNQKNYIIFDGFKLYKGIFYLNQCNNVIIQNCEMYGGWVHAGDPSYTNMVFLRYAQNCTIQNNIIYGNKDTAPDQQTNQAAVILHWSDDCIIQNNLFYDNVIHYRNKCGDTTYGLRNIVRYNIFRDAISTGIYMGGYAGASTDNKIYQNIFIGNYSRISLNIGNPGTLIYNNVFYNGTNSGIVYGQIDENITNQVYNNIFYNMANCIGCDLLSWPTNLYVDYNAYYTYTGFWHNGSYDNLATFTSDVGNNTNIVITDPLFVSPPNNFKLQDSSPCKGTGKNGENMGAYITGSEQIGYSNGGGSSSTIGPGVTIQGGSWR